MIKCRVYDKTKLLIKLQIQFKLKMYTSLVPLLIFILYAERVQHILENLQFIAYV